MRWTAIIAILMVLVMPFPAARAQSADDGVMITEIFPDPPGSDILGEYIEIKNTGNPVCLLNWTISDQDGCVDLVFPDIVLDTGERAVIYVGKGENRSENGTFFLYMWKSSSMLNNDGDDVLLSDAEGNPVDYVAYGNGKYVDSPPENMVWEKNIEVEEGLALERSSDTGDWFWGMPTPGMENPDFDASPGVRISSFYPCARYDDEFVEIDNAGDAPADISGCYLSDGEGLLYFPAGTIIAPGSSIYVTQNRSGFLGEMGFAPDLTYDDCYTPSHYPQMSNTGDEMGIYSPSGMEISKVSYGDGAQLPTPKRGEIYYHDGVWKLRRIGRSSFPVFNISYDGSMALFNAPESSLRAVMDEISSAEKEVLVNLYQFRSQEIAQALMGAMSRGVKVRILVEGGPVGGIPDEEMAVLSALSSAGAEIRVMDNNDRYSFDHAKYMVVDSKSLLICSENFNGDAMSVDGTGNRGWGVVIRNESAARYMREIFMYDYNLNFSDISELSIQKYNVSVEWAPHPPRAMEPVEIKGEFNITIVPGPEHGLHEIIDAIESAERSLYIEQFYITHMWNSGTERNPLLDAVINASLRGCDVKILLDGSYYNTDGDFDNDEIAGFLNGFAEEHGVNLSARVIDLEKHGLVKVHNKGMIIDGRKVMISSFNWGQNSFTNNRELAVFIENRDVASYFTSLFMDDWKSDFEPPSARINGTDALYVNTTYNFTSESHDDTGISSVLWNLDGKDISTDFTISLNFSTPGEHVLTLTVWDYDGNCNTTAMRLRVMPVTSNTGGLEEGHEDIEKSPAMVSDAGNDGPPDYTSNANDGSPEDNENGVENDGPEIIPYILVVPALLIILSAIKLSWKRESHS